MRTMFGRSSAAVDWPKAKRIATAVVTILIVHLGLGNFWRALLEIFSSRPLYGICRRFANRNGLTADSERVDDGSVRLAGAVVACAPSVDHASRRRTRSADAAF